MNAHGLVEPHAIVIHKTLGLVAPVVPFGDGRLHAQAGQFQQAVEAGEGLGLAEFRGEFAQALLAQTAGAELPANVSQHQLRRAAVGADDALDLRVALEGALIAHGGQMQALVEGLFRLARAGAGHRPANVALVGDGAGEGDQGALRKHGRDDAHVGRMGAAALIGMVDEKGVAFLDVVIFADDRLAAGGEGADMQRQHHMLGHHIAHSVHDGAGCVLALANDG